jgi:hypothetical protein
MHKPQATLPPLRRLRVITCRVTLDVPLQLVIKVSNLLRKRRKELGTRNGTRALTCYQQAVFILTWFGDRPGLSRPVMTGRSMSYRRTGSYPRRPAPGPPAGVAVGGATCRYPGARSFALLPGRLLPFAGSGRSGFLVGPDRGFTL